MMRTYFSTLMLKGTPAASGCSLKQGNFFKLSVTIQPAPMQREYLLITQLVKFKRNPKMNLLSNGLDWA